MQRQRQKTKRTGCKTVITKGRDGNVKRVITGDTEYEFKNHQWQVKTPKQKKIKKLSAKQEAIVFANRLRNKATPAEKLLLSLLRSIGISHHFQKMIKTDSGYRFADFYIPGLNWVIEVDGGYHNELEQQEKDAIRDKAITKAKNCRIVRFTNEEIDRNPQGVVEVIIDGIRKKLMEAVGKEQFIAVCQ